MQKKWPLILANLSWVIIALAFIFCLGGFHPSDQLRNKVLLFSSLAVTGVNIPVFITIISAIAKKNYNIQILKVTLFLIIRLCSIAYVTSFIYSISNEHRGTSNLASRIVTLSDVELISIIKTTDTTYSLTALIVEVEKRKLIYFNYIYQDKSGSVYELVEKDSSDKQLRTKYLLYKQSIADQLSSGERDILYYELNKNNVAVNSSKINTTNTTSLLAKMEENDTVYLLYETSGCQYHVKEKIVLYYYRHQVWASLYTIAPNKKNDENVISEIISDSAVQIYNNFETELKKLSNHKQVPPCATVTENYYLYSKQDTIKVNKTCTMFSSYLRLKSVLFEKINLKGWCGG